MTDQDPTQGYEAPPPAPSAAPPVPPASPGQPPAAPAFAPPEAAVATTPVAATPAPRRRRGVLRWAVALVVVLLVAGSAAAAGVLLTGASGTPEVAAWTPANSVVYAEARLDLPGSQQAELAKVLSAFPGFDDQAALPTKISEALDQLVKRVSDGKQTYTGDIQPWFGGQLGFSVGSLPTGTPNPSDVHALVLAGTKDAAKAAAWAARTLQESGSTSTTETYNGVTITTIAPTPSDAPAMASAKVAYATYGPVLAIGDVASVKASIDTGGKTGLGSNEQFKTASSSLPGDRLAFEYQDSEAIIDAGKAAGNAASPGAGADLPAILDDLYAPWTAFAVRAENGAFVIESRQPHVDKLGPAKTAESTLPSLVPPDTIVLAEGHDVGATLKRLKDLAAADPKLGGPVKQVDDALNLLGGFDAVTGWMGEAGVAIAKTGDTLGGGLVVVPSDKAAAQRLFTQLHGFLQLAGGQAGIKIADETYKDATVTTLDLSGIGPMAGAAGVDLPANLKLAYAVTDQVVVVGSSVDFVKSVLDAREGPSLADQPRFQDALGRVDKVNGGLTWVDVDGVRTFAEPLIPADKQHDYASNIKPYLEPFEVLIATSVPGDQLDSGKAVITVAGN